MNKKTTLNLAFRGWMMCCFILLSQIASPQICPDINQRVYANSQSWLSSLLGSVSNATNAIDGDPTTHSTINTGVVLVGLGTTYQELSWGGADIAAGTPLSVKLGANTNLLSVGATILIQARRDGANVGSSQIVTGNILNLISGESV